MSNVECRMEVESSACHLSFVICHSLDLRFSSLVIFRQISFEV